MLESFRQLTGRLSRTNGEKESPRAATPLCAGECASCVLLNEGQAARRPHTKLAPTSVCPWRRPSRRTGETKGFSIGMSLPRAEPAVVTGRNQTTADAARKGVSPHF